MDMHHIDAQGCRLLAGARLRSAARDLALAAAAEARLAALAAEGGES